jgi:outer membrane protein TolC
MKRILLIFSILILCFDLYSQNTVEQVIAEVEKNNTTLIALKKAADAQKLSNKTGIFLQNPEAEFNYLWGDPSQIGNRTDFSILQSFDFPSAYGLKSQISDLKNEQADLEYRKQWLSVQLRTNHLCSDLIYTNALYSELSRRLAYAQSIAESFQLKFEKGETNVLENNKAKLNLLNVSKGLESIGIERDALLSELAMLNGGQPLAFTGKEYQAKEIPLDFEQWYMLMEEKNPTFGWLKKEIEISRKQTGLNRAMSLPKLQAGYMSETVVGQQYQGISVGMTIPLWENKNKVKFAEANAQALESYATDHKIQFYNHLKALHAKSIALQKNVNDYRKDLRSFDNTDLLKNALDKGEISLINYIVELSLYYESVSKLLELERDMNKTLAELNQFI